MAASRSFVRDRTALAVALALAAGCSVEASPAPLVVQGADDGGAVAGEKCLASNAPRRGPGDECACDTDCSTGTCRGGVCCAGNACGGKRPAGARCTTAEQCQSSFCADGVCCNVACTGPCVSCNEPDSPGDCRPSALGTPDPHDQCRRDPAESCGSSGRCNGQGGCAKHAAGTICKLSACDGTEKLIPASVCDGEGSCIVGVAISCAPSSCDQRNCRITCASNADCAPPATCENGSCGKFGDGQDCTGNDQCHSGFCVDGVCCGTACAGSCQTCSLPNARGVCTPVRAGLPDPRTGCVDQGPPSCGTNGSCDGKGGCQGYADGTVCQSPSCDPEGNAENPTGACQAGKCEIPAARSCAPFRGCAANHCAAVCGSDAQCTTGSVCNAGDCGRRANAALCSKDADCSSGSCAQGRCCDGPCTGSCVACNLAGHEGTCSKVAAGGADPAGLCRDDQCSNGCDGQGGCQRERAGSTCGGASCGGGNARTLRTCSAAGACQTSTDSCGGGLVCSEGSCAAPARRPDGGDCVNDGDCASKACVAGKCCAGSCAGDCMQCTSATGWACKARANDAACGGGRTCQGGQCKKKGAGLACGNGIECDSGSCVGGHCCATACAGQCQTCQGPDWTCKGDNGLCGGGQVCGSGGSCTCPSGDLPCGNGCCKAGEICQGGATKTCAAMATPVDCKVTDWGPWSRCNKDCGGGTQSRSRTVTAPAQNGGQCPALTATQDCNVQACATAVDCVVGAFGDWSACSKDCGGGTQMRTRKVVTPAMNGGKDCPDLGETQPCNTQACPKPIDCVVSDWTDWSKCSKDCGGGTQQRTRKVSTPAQNGGAGCPDLSETRPCNELPCLPPVPPPPAIPPVL
jgi:thrombospondin type 1 repeat protein